MKLNVPTLSHDRQSRCADERRVINVTGSDGAVTILLILHEKIGITPSAPLIMQQPILIRPVGVCSANNNPDSDVSNRRTFVRPLSPLSGGPPGITRRPNNRFYCYLLLNFQWSVCSVRARVRDANTSLSRVSEIKPLLALRTCVQIIIIIIVVCDMRMTFVNLPVE